jgi:chemotaxis protein CheX
MNMHELIIGCINRSSLDVFSTMLGVDLSEGESALETGAPDPNDGVVSFIGVAGPWAGTGSICCSPSLACRVCNQLLMTEYTAVNEEVLDAVAELTNMIVGSVKTDLEQHLGPLGLSIPTVVFGRNFRTKSAGSTEWIVVRFGWEGEILTVKLCLTQTDRSMHILSHAPSHACQLDV